MGEFIETSEQVETSLDEEYLNKLKSITKSKGQILSDEEMNQLAEVFSGFYDFTIKKDAKISTLEEDIKSLKNKEGSNE